MRKASVTLRVRAVAGVLALISLVAAAAATAAPPPDFTCGDVVQPTGVGATDALATLQTAVSLRSCEPCACDADGSAAITAADALLILKRGVGQDIALHCPFCCAACGCTPQTITLALADLAPCEGCVPRIPASNSAADSIQITFATGFNGTHELAAVGECVWEATLPGAIEQIAYFGSGNTVCSGSPGDFASGGNVTLRVVRDGGDWVVRAGTYTASLGWGDVVTASATSATCETGGSGANQNEVCHLADANSPNDYDTHVVDGSATITVGSEDLVCIGSASP